MIHLGLASLDSLQSLYTQLSSNKTQVHTNKLVYKYYLVDILKEDKSAVLV